MAEKVGEFYIRVGLMTPEQVEAVLQAQREGDSRRFGDIAHERGYIGDGAARLFADYLEKQTGS